MPTPAAILDSKVTFNDTILATKESSTSAKDKKPAPPTSSASTDAALVNSSSTARTSSTLPTAKDTTIEGAVPDIKETASSVTDKKSASSQEVSAEVTQNYVKPKVVDKVFDLPVVSDTYDSLVKLSSPLSPYVEKIGTVTSPMVDQALDLKAGFEGKIPEIIQAGYTTALNKVSSVYPWNLNPWLFLGCHGGGLSGRFPLLGGWHLGGEGSCLEAIHADAVQLDQVCLTDVD